MMRALLALCEFCFELELLSVFFALIGRLLLVGQHCRFACDS